MMNGHIVSVALAMGFLSCGVIGNPVRARELHTVWPINKRAGFPIENGDFPFENGDL